MRKIIIGKLKESVMSVLPITILVIIISFFVNIGKENMVNFLLSVLLLIGGMSLFTLGSDSAMIPIGKEIGTHLTQKRSLVFLIAISFIIGFMITIAEPDLTVLAEQFDGLKTKYYLIIPVALGVGVFLVLAALRIIFQIKLSYLLIISYMLVFTIAFFVVPEFVPISLDSGGVTTGPITVPFILALGTGIAMARGDSRSEEDSFGMVALCSIGPIIAVLVLGLFLGKATIDTETVVYSNIGVIVVKNIKEVGLALAPFAIFFAGYQLIYLKLKAKKIKKIAIGILFTYLGLVLFLTGANFGFMPVGIIFGEKLGALDFNWILIPLGALLGFFTVMAEPAVHVLNHQVEEITSGAISKRLMLLSLAIGVSISVALAMLRIVFDISIWWFVIPGYIIALGLMFFVPKIFTAIAFDSGGVASGPMTATFILPLAIGVGTIIDHSKVLMNAFGIVAFVAMTPLIVIQLLGLVYKIKLNRKKNKDIEEEDLDIITFKKRESKKTGEQGDD
ncbi:MAG: DUF1538 domain-containing protein [Bacilli bacterium]|jgi:hypothetical protein|nr:DUF1538 domain-containing protein [Bacilli bacterium]